MNARDKLRAYWSKKENDLMLYCPVGLNTKSDARFLYGVFTKEFQAELESRGYDFITLRFEISPKKDNRKFVSERK